MDYQDADVTQIAEQLANNKKANIKTAILVGAGISATAGIPTASKMVEILKKEYPSLAKKCGNESYSHYMGLLSPDERQNFIGRFVKKAKINVAHLYLASLINQKYIDRVLTTNFDPLIIRSLALFNEYPAIHDCASSQVFIPGNADEISLFYLHGLHNGFVLLNTSKEVEKHSEKLKNIFEDSLRKRCWIVIGYSGENDPVFDRLAEVDTFRSKLYWVGYKDEEPKEHVLKRILNPEEKYGFFVKGYDADTFFSGLAWALQLEEPSIISRPFSYLKETIENISDFPFGKRKMSRIIEVKNWIEQAIKGFEQGKGFDKDDELTKITREIWVNNRFKEIDEVYSRVKASNNKEAKENLANALYNLGNKILDTEGNVDSKNTEDIYKRAFESYEKAVGLKPDYHQVFNNWGNKLSTLASKKDGEESENLFRKCFEKYAEAVKIKTDKYETYNNWGNSLRSFAQKKKGKESEDLLLESIKKYKSAIEIKPDFHQAYKNCGMAFVELAQEKVGEEKRKYLDRSIKLFERAEEIENHTVAKLEAPAQ